MLRNILEMKSVKKLGLVGAVTATWAFQTQGIAASETAFSCFVDTGSDLTINLVVEEEKLSILRSSPEARYAPECHPIQRVEYSDPRRAGGPLHFSCRYLNENDPNRYGYKVEVYESELGDAGVVAVYQSSKNARYAPLMWKVQRNEK